MSTAMWRTFLISIAVPLAVTLLLMVLYLRRDRERTEEGVLLRAYRAVGYIGCMGTVFFVFMMFVCIRDAESRTEMVEDLIIFNMLALSCILLVYIRSMYYFFLPKDAKYFFYRSFSGRMYQIRFVDCLNYKMHVERNNWDITLRAVVKTSKGKKKIITISIFPLTKNLDVLVRALNSRHVRRRY